MAEYRLRFSKGKDLKFLSHLDLIKTVERALRRAELPLAYSEGFHPHPKLGFGPALAVGISSMDEYFDIQLEQDMEPEQLKKLLNRVLPEGIRILAIKRIPHHVKPLNAVINRASYVVLLKVIPTDLADIVNQLSGLLELSEINLHRSSKDGQKLVNIRPWLHTLKVATINSETLEISLSGEIGSGGNLRPEEIIGSIKQPIEVINLARTGLWHEEQGIIFKPLDFCDKAGG